MSDFSRYARQMVLEEIGEDGQRALAQARVLCVGAGGLGCPAMLYLAAAGIGFIGIIDSDHVSESNLQRQVLFTQDDIGQSKARVALSKLKALNPHVKGQAYEESLTAQNAAELCGAHDIIIDGSDNFDTSFLINDVCKKLNKPWVYASILGFSGQMGVFHDGACLRCLFPHKPPQDVMNCAEAGILGPVAGNLGTLQALEVIKFVTGMGSMAGYLSIDFKSMKQSIIALARDPDCPVCSKRPEEIIIMSDNISIEETKAQIANGAVLIDVREQNEWDAGHIDGALLMPLSVLMAGAPIEDVAKDANIILHCKSGKRSQTAQQIFRAQGFDNVLNMVVGYDGWVA